MAQESSRKTQENVESQESGLDVERLWKENTAAIKGFLQRQPEYERLCSEVAYILKRELQRGGIEFSTIAKRAKSLDSFLEKVQRKSYADPLGEITDFAGVRVVCLYTDELPKVEAIIAEHFEIVEKIDKLKHRRADQFGYGAIHFVVRIGEKSSGARYDDLKHLVCEIQTRTVLQDAWAIIDHHLVYKNESNIPSVLRNRLNLLAGNFESADQKFSDLRAEREEYLQRVTDSAVDESRFLENELNLDSFVRYADWKFPELPNGSKFLDAPFYLKPLTEMEIRDLRDLDALVNEGMPAYRRYLDENGRDFLNSYSLTSVVLAAVFVRPQFIPEHIKSVFPKFGEFIKTLF